MRVSHYLAATFAATVLVVVASTLSSMLWSALVAHLPF